MASLVSAGVSVPVTDRSFYIPSSSPTVPFFFIATRANKTQPDGVSVADGTNEYGVVRTITSIGQSVQTYGIPYFWSDNSAAGNLPAQHHGDARNEYGLFAINQFLGTGSRCFAVRANIDLTDSPRVFMSAGVPQIDTISGIRTGNGVIENISVPSQFKEPEEFTIIAIGNQIGETAMSFTVTGSLSGMIGIARAGVEFNNPAIHFTIMEDTSPTGIPFSTGDYFQFNTIYVPATFTGVGNGTVIDINSGSGLIADEDFTIVFTSQTTFTVTGTNPITAAVSTPTINGVVGLPFSDPQDKIGFTILEGSNPFAVTDQFVIEFKKIQLFNQLGSTDATKRQAIVTALQAAVNSNQAIRSEMFEYNLIACPGYPEVVDELLALSDGINNEAFVVADTPVNKNPEQTANWANTSERFSHVDVAYYYPWCLASNLDGTDVVVAPSGTALRTYAYSDNISYIWEAPAGVRRGVVTGVSKVGYVTGTLGQATTFVEAILNEGQRDNLYEFYKNINPITYFPGRGLIIWGQKTSSPAASARDRVNVERLLCYVRRSLRKAGFPFCFEINNARTRGDLKFMLDGFFGDLLVKGGVEDYITLCDLSNNTPYVINNNQIIADTGIIPPHVAEFVILPVTVYSSGAKMGQN